MGLLAAVLLGLADCGGGSHSALPVSPSGPTTSSYQYAPATFVIGVPKQAASSSDKRSPRYISAATQSIKVTVTMVNGSAVTLTPGTTNVAGCPTDPGNPGNFRCTVSASLPIGTDTLSIGTYDAANAGGNLISQQFTTVTIVQGAANGPPTAGYTFTLDANPSTINISPPGSGVTGSVGSGFTVNGSSALTFTATVNDAHGTTLTNNAIPGSPVLSATSSTPGVAAITSTSQNPYSITITPGGSSGTATITVKASPANAGDGLTFSQVQFNVSSVPTLVAVGGCASSGCEIDMYTMSGVNFTHYGTISGTGIGSYSAAVLGFDTTNRLYMYDNNSDVILEYPFSQLQALNQSNTQPTLPTPITNGINSNTNASMYSTFEVAPDGTMAVANPIGNLDQLVKFSPAATTYSLGRTFPGPTAGGPGPYWYRGFAVSVLTTTTGTPFGYAAALLSDNGAANNFNSATAVDGPSEIAVLSSPGTITGGTTTTCDPGTISCEETDLTNNGLSVNEIQPPTMVWDPADQKLVVANNDTGVITQTPYSGGVFGAPTTIASGVPVSHHIHLSVSRDGHLAVADSDLNNTYVTIYDRNRTVVPGWNAKNFGAWTFDSIGFLADNSLLIAGGPSPSNYLEHFLLTNSTTIPDATVQITGATLGLSDVSVSGQSHQRRVLGRRHFLSLPGMPH